MIESGTADRIGAIAGVDFGTPHALEVRVPIETLGDAARGFNVYDDMLGRTLFDRITTHSDGAVGVQISRRCSGG